jgi:release factor glutamine methyltransferase
MRIRSNQYRSVMQFAMKELQGIYPLEEIKALMYWLFDEYLGVDKSQYILNPQKGMSESELLLFHFAIKDLKKGKPIQYIIGHTFFYGLKILVNEHTLIPRPETEELVEWVLENTKDEEPPLKILDLCTGTACICIALAHKMPEHQFWGGDFKYEILDLAGKNASFHKKEINFFKIDLINDVFTKTHEFDIIAANPPYVLESEKQQMHQNVLAYEPKSALFVSNSNPLLFYDKILDFAVLNLKNSGTVFFEINENKSLDIEYLLLKRAFHNIEFKNDFSGKIRFVKAQKK